MKRFLILPSLLLAASLRVAALDAVLEWDAPRDGDPVSRYEVYALWKGSPVLLAGTDRAETSATLTLTPGTHFLFAVSIGEDGRVSPRSNDLPLSVIRIALEESDDLTTWRVLWQKEQFEADRQFLRARIEHEP